MEESERLTKLKNIMKLVESEKCPTHNLTAFVEAISHNLIVDYKTCCPEFGDYINAELDKINPKTMH